MLVKLSCHPARRRKSAERRLWKSCSWKGSALNPFGHTYCCKHGCLCGGLPLELQWSGKALPAGLWAEHFCGKALPAGPWERHLNGKALLAGLWEGHSSGKALPAGPWGGHCNGKALSAGPWEGHFSGTALPARLWEGISVEKQCLWAVSKAFLWAQHSPRR